MHQHEMDEQKIMGKISGEKEDCYFARIISDQAVFSSIQMETVTTTNLSEPWPLSFEKTEMHKKKNDGFNMMVLLVSLLHVLLFFCIDKLWQHNLDNRRPKIISKAAMNSYLYVSPAPKIDTPTPVDVKTIPSQIDEPKLMARREVLPEIRSVKSALKRESNQVTKQQDIVLDLDDSADKDMSEKSVLVSQAGLIKQANLKWKVETATKESINLNTSNASFRFDETDPFTSLNAINNRSNINGMNNRSFDGLLDEGTLSYLQQEHASKVNQFAKEQASLAAETATLSDMTPAPNTFNLPQSASSLTGLPVVHGQLMDPSRVVQKGNFCYRMIKTPTQINPHAEIVSTIGYRCRADENKQNVQNLINQRLKQRDVVIH